MYIHVVDTRITLTRSLLIVSSFLFLLCLPSSPFLSSCSSSVYLDYRFPSPLCSSTLPSFLTFLLFFPVSFLFFVLYRHKSFVNVNITYVAGLSPSLYLSLLSLLLLPLPYGPVQLFTSLLAFSLLTFPLPLLPLHISFSTVLTPFSPLLSCPLPQPTTFPSSLSPFPPIPTESLYESTKTSY